MGGNKEAMSGERPGLGDSTSGPAVFGHLLSECCINFCLKIARQALSLKMFELYFDLINEKMIWEYAVEGLWP